MTLRVLIAGYYGAGNAGDEWILEALIGALRRRVPQSEVRVLSYDPPATRRRHGVEAVGWGDLEGLAEAVRWSSLVVVGGGGLWQDYWGFEPLDILSGRPGGIAGYGTPLVLAHLLGRPSALLGAGVGPLRDPASRAAMRDLAAMAGVVSVRDAASCDQLIACGLPADRIHLGADLAFLADPDPQSAQGLAALGAPRPVLAVALRKWTFAGDPARWEAGIAAAVGEWCAAREGQVVFVPLHDSSQPLEDDRLVAERVAAQVGLPDRVRLAPAGASSTERLRLLAAADLVLGMRYHALLAALSAGVPCVGLAYDPKVAHLMEEAGAGERVLELEELDSGELAMLLGEARGEAAGKGQIEALRKRARDSLGRAIELEQAPAQEGPPALLPGFVLGQAAHLTTLEAALRRQFDLPASYGSRAEAGVSAVEAAAGRLKSAEGELAHVREELKKERGKLERAAAAVEALEARLGTTSHRVGLLEARVRDAEAQASAMRRESAASEAQLAQLRSTKGVRVLNMYWGLRERLRPWKSRAAAVIRRISRPARRLVELPFRRILFVVRHGLELPAILPPVYLYTDRSDLFPGYALRRPLHHPERRIGVSLVVTMRDEEASARAWFDAILAQARLPDEVVIVDNGSTDGSAELLAAFASEASVPVRIVDGHGHSVGACRNLGVDATRFEILAFTDFGCVPDQHWLERLVIPLEGDDAVSVSAGWYEVNPAPGPGTSFASDLLPSIEGICPDSFLPATRSVAIRRGAWSRVDGFPEWLSYAGEDTLIDLRWKSQRDPWAFVPEAVVRWDPPKTVRDFWDKAHVWSKGDGESGAFAASYLSRLLRLAIPAGVGTAGGCLLILGLALRVPAMTAAGAAAVILSFAGFAVMAVRGKRPEAPALVRLLGQFARSVGFVDGVASRPTVNARRYSEAGRVVLILAAVPWDDTGGGSRGAQLANEFVRRGDLVVYVYRFPKQETVELKIPCPAEGFVHLPLEHFDWAAFEWEFGPILADRQLLAIVECPDRGFLPIIRRWRKVGGKVVYDLIDDWTTSLGAAWFSGAVEKAIVSQSDLLTASAPGLVRRLDELYQREALLLPNAVNLELFDASKEYARPDDLPRARFVALYVGALWGEWFDWELLAACAQAYPDAALVMIGDYRGQCPSPEPNMHFLGLKPHGSLPAYLAHVDVGVLPWRVSPITQATSPLKVYEYIAMGLPVVAPDIVPLHGLPAVHCFAGEADFVKSLDVVGTSRRRNPAATQFLANSSWSYRAGQLLAAVGMEPAPDQAHGMPNDGPYHRRPAGALPLIATVCPPLEADQGRLPRHGAGGTGEASGSLGAPGGRPAAGHAHWGSTNPIGSVVIPCFNYGRYLGEAVRSALGQSLRDLEVIVVDDGSSDETTRKVIGSLSHPRITVIRQANRGVSAARNTGVAASRGKYICCLDADDTLDPTYIEKAVALLECRPGIGVAYPWTRRFGEAEGLWLSEPFDFPALLQRNLLTVCGVFRKDGWLSVGGFSEELREGYEDWDFWISLAASGYPGALIPEVLFNRRKHGRSMIDGAVEMHESIVSKIRARHLALYAGPDAAERIQAGFRDEPAAEPFSNLARRSQFARGIGPPLSVLFTASRIERGSFSEDLARITADLAGPSAHELVWLSSAPPPDPSRTGTGTHSGTAYYLSAFLPAACYSAFVDNFLQTGNFQRLGVTWDFPMMDRILSARAANSRLHAACYIVSGASPSGARVPSAVPPGFDEYVATAASRALLADISGIPQDNLRILA